MAEKSERCVLCLDEKRSPVRITCGHSFCNECLDVYKSYQKYAWANRCPICRGSLKEKRRSVKKSLSLTTNSNTNLTATTTTSSATNAPIEQIYLLEEFMAIATDSDATEEDEYFSEDDQEDFYYFDDDEDDDDVYDEDVDEPLDYESEHSDEDVVMLDEDWKFYVIIALFVLLMASSPLLVILAIVVNSK